MSGYKSHEPTVYVVRWDEEDLVKVGFSEQQRWRNFTNRGAELLALFRFDDTTPAFALETVGQHYLAEHGRYAFDERTPAVPFLGHNGDGWMECYSASRSTTEEMLKHMLDGHLSICPSHATRCHVRTNVRTQLTYAAKTEDSHLTFLMRLTLWISRISRRDVTE